MLDRLTILKLFFIKSFSGVPRGVVKDTLPVLYKAIVQPYVDYCCSLWDNCGKVLKEKI